MQKDCKWSILKNNYKTFTIINDIINNIRKHNNKEMMTVVITV